MKNRFPWILMLLGFSFSFVMCKNENSKEHFITIKPHIIKHDPPKLNGLSIRDSIVFIKNVLTIGSLKRDTTVRIPYRFLNNSTRPVVVDRVVGSCGCLKFDFKRTPLPPGKQETIFVTFETGSLNGHFKKEIVVFFKPDVSVHLFFTVNVI